MVLADMSQTELTRRKKARALAAFRASNPTTPEQGPGGQTAAESLRVDRQRGQRAYTTYGGGMTPITVAPCCSVSVP
jgi:hypothetical protein